MPKSAETLDTKSLEGKCNGLESPEDEDDEYGAEVLEDVEEELGSLK